ncbi:MAG: hypothetical protein M1829_005520 [Trizodia sp. TS-e1964]|nr:MAG: hypothetical protein M1829_005520 [Trizodia sp. TS-e1964]
MPLDPYPSSYFSPLLTPPRTEPPLPTPRTPPKAIPWKHPNMPARKTPFPVGASLIERLPMEVLQAVFVSSANPNLPLASSTLMAMLPPNKLVKQQLACSMLGSRSYWAKATLITRRFCTPKILAGAIRSLKKSPCILDNNDECTRGRERHPHNTCPLHVRFDVKLHLRFFTRIIGFSGPGPDETPWQVEFLRLLLRWFVVDVKPLMESRDWPSIGDSVQAKVLRAAAQASLHEIVVARNFDAAWYFTGQMQQVDADTALSSRIIIIKPSLDTVRHVVVEMNCEHPEFVTAVFNAVWFWSRNDWEDEAVEKWIEDRKYADDLAREFDSNARHASYLGEWVEFLWSERNGGNRPEEVMEKLTYSGFLGQHHERQARLANLQA